MYLNIRMALEATSRLPNSASRASKWASCHMCKLTKLASEQGEPAAFSLWQCASSYDPCHRRTYLSTWPPEFMHSVNCISPSLHWIYSRVVLHSIDSKKCVYYSRMILLHARALLSVLESSSYIVHQINMQWDRFLESWLQPPFSSRGKLCLPSWSEKVEIKNTHTLRSRTHITWIQWVDIRIWRFKNKVSKFQQAAPI